MRTIKILTIAFVLFVTLVLSGCTPTVRLYDGPELASYKVAKLELPGCTQLTVDGKSVEWDRSYRYRSPFIGTEADWVRVEMLPGLHKIKWSFQSPVSTCTFEGVGTLDAKSGKQYKVHFARLKGKKELGRSYNTPEGRAHEFIFEVKDYATWIEERYPWEDKVVVGTKPEWTEEHVCEICGKEKAFGCEYGCFKCRSKLKMTLPAYW